MVKRSALRKITWRTVRQSLGRYLAIVGIIALGTGFFAGLRVTKTAMTKTVEQYFTDTSFYQFRLLCTLGFTDEDATAISGVDGVKSAEGSYTKDLLVSDPEGETVVFTALSLTENVNLPKLTAGRMPEKADECLLDAFAYKEDAIGKKILVSTENDSDTLDFFSCREYTVTGLCYTPVYLNYERGTSKLGNGSVKAFMILPKEGFSSDYYTELYVSLVETSPLYGEEADALSDRFSDLLLEETEKRGDVRLADETADARRELSDAKEKLTTGTADYRDGITDACTAIEEAKAKLVSGEKEYYEGLGALWQKESELSDAKDGYSAAQQFYQGAGAMASALSLSETDLVFTAASDPAAAPLFSSYQSFSAESTGAAGFLADYAYTSSLLDTLSMNLTGNHASLNEAGLSVVGTALTAANDSLQTARTSLYTARSELQSGKAELLKAKETLAAELSDAKKELLDAEQKLEDGEKELSELTVSCYALGRNTNTGYVCFESDSDIVEGVAKIFPLFFFLVAALVVLTTVSRMVEDDRTEIGTLKALGYGGLSVSRKYLVYSGSAALIGCGVGLSLGAWIFPTVLWSVYSIMYGHFSPIVFVFDLPLSAICAAVCILGALCTAWISCRSELRSSPAMLIRPKSPPSGKRILLEHVGFFWKRLKFLHKVSLRNIFRYKKRLCMMLLGVAGCTALLLAGFGIGDSIQNFVGYQFDEITLYDCDVNFTEPLTPSDRESFSDSLSSDVSGVVFLQLGSVDILCEDNTVKTAKLAAPDGDLTGFMDFHTGDTPVPFPKSGECIMNRKLADACGVSPGDPVTFRDKDMNTLTLTLSAIYDNYVFNYIYTPFSSLAPWGDAAKLQSAYLNFTSDADVHLAAAEVADQKLVSGISLNSDLRTRVNGMLKSMDSIVLLVVFCAGALAFIVIYNLTNINITERAREIATLKVLGFRFSETAAYVFRENLILTLFGSLLGLPLGVLLHRYVMNQIQIDLMTFDIRIAALSFILAVVLTLVFSLLVDLILLRRISRIDMAESLKSVE